MQSRSTHFLLATYCLCGEKTGEQLPWSPTEKTVWRDVVVKRGPWAQLDAVSMEKCNVGWGTAHSCPPVQSQRPIACPVEKTGDRCTNGESWDLAAEEGYMLHVTVSAYLYVPAGKGEVSHQHESQAMHLSQSLPHRPRSGQSKYKFQLSSLCKVMVGSPGVIQCLGNPDTTVSFQPSWS